VLQVAGLDVLRDEGLAYAARLESEGVPVTLLRAEGLPHAFGNLAGALPEAEDALRRAARALGAQMAEPRG
jgi:acetyl esterase